MVASIDNISSSSQGASYCEKDDPVHRKASAWAGRPAEGLGQLQFRIPRRCRAVERRIMLICLPARRNGKD